MNGSDQSGAVGGVEADCSLAIESISCMAVRRTLQRVHCESQLTDVLVRSFVLKAASGA